MILFYLKRKLDIWPSVPSTRTLKPLSKSFALLPPPIPWDLGRPAPLGIRESGADTSKSKLPCGYKDLVKDKGLIMTWCNQLELLAHQATNCFVTHCGFNSTLESLCLGVPVVCLPQWTDQSTNAKFLEAIWEVGVWLKEDEKEIVRKQEFVMSLKVVMEGERSQEIRRNANKWKKVGQGGSSDNLINNFVYHLTNA
ncbi:hypothetical protein VNO78_08464 [Psophocarpus tetragonolobus]|uniref:UDP-glycosyltransferases domain-containing protein n=1 Tax=Psophocarpus tetragonolobus TaxID=3891 RepID=A0AAN9SW44_PSOTE